MITVKFILCIWYALLTMVPQDPSARLIMLHKRTAICKSQLAPITENPGQNKLLVTYLQRTIPGFSSSATQASKTWTEVDCYSPTCTNTWMCCFLKVHSCPSKGHVYSYKTVQLQGICSTPNSVSENSKISNDHGYGNLDVIAMDIRKCQNCCSCLLWQLFAKDLITKV